MMEEKREVVGVKRRLMGERENNGKERASDGEDFTSCWRQKWKNKRGGTGESHDLYDSFQNLKK